MACSSISGFLLSPSVKYLRFRMDPHKPRNISTFIRSNAPSPPKKKESLIRGLFLSNGVWWLGPVKLASPEENPLDHHRRNSNKGDPNWTEAGLTASKHRSLLRQAAQVARTALRTDALITHTHNRLQIEICDRDARHRDGMWYLKFYLCGQELLKLFWETFGSFHVKSNTAVPDSLRFWWKLVYL